MNLIILLEKKMEMAFRDRYQPNKSPPLPLQLEGIIFMTKSESRWFSSLFEKAMVLLRYVT